MTHTTTAFRVTIKDRPTYMKSFREIRQKNYDKSDVYVQHTYPPAAPTWNQLQYPAPDNQYPRDFGYMNQQAMGSGMALSKFDRLTEAISNHCNSIYRLVVEGVHRDEIVGELARDILSYDHGTHDFNGILTDTFINLSYLSYKGSKTPIVYFSAHSSYREAFMATVKLLDKVRENDVFTLHHVDRIFEAPRFGIIGPSTLTRFINNFREEAIVIASVPEGIEGHLDRNLIITVNLEEVEVNEFFTEELNKPGYIQTKIDPIACSVDSLIDELVMMGYDSEEEIDEDRVREIRALIKLKINPQELNRMFFMSTHKERFNKHSSLEDVFPKKQ